MLLPLCRRGYNKNLTFQVSSYVTSLHEHTLHTEIQKGVEDVSKTINHFVIGIWNVLYFGVSFLDAGGISDEVGLP